MVGQQHQQQPSQPFFDQAPTLPRSALPTSSFIPLSSISAQATDQTQLLFQELQRQQQQLEGTAAAAGALLPPQQQALLQQELLDSVTNGSRAGLRSYTTMPAPPRWNGNALGLPPPVAPQSFDPGWMASLQSQQIVSQQPQQPPPPRLPLIPSSAPPAYLPHFDPSSLRTQELQQHGSWPAAQYDNYAAALAGDQRRADDAQLLEALHRQHAGAAPPAGSNNGRPSALPPFPRGGPPLYPGRVGFDASADRSGTLPAWPPASRGRPPMHLPTPAAASAALQGEHAWGLGEFSRGRLRGLQGSAEGGARYSPWPMSGPQDSSHSQQQQREPSPAAQSSVQRAHAALSRARAVSRGHSRGGGSREPGLRPPHDRGDAWSEVLDDEASSSVWQHEVDFSGRRGGAAVVS